MTIVGYVIEIARKVDDQWFKREIRVDSIEEVKDYFEKNPRSCKIGLRVIRKVPDIGINLN